MQGSPEGGEERSRAEQEDCSWVERERRDRWPEEQEEAQKQEEEEGVRVRVEAVDP